MSAVLRSVQAKSKVLSKLFRLVSGSEGPTSHSHLLAKGCAMPAVLENGSIGPIFLSKVQKCRLLPDSAVIQLSKPQCVFRNHKISRNNRLFASSQIPHLRKAFFPPVLLFPTLQVKCVFRGKLKLSKRVRLSSSGNHSVHNHFLKQNTWWLMSMFLLWQNPSPPIFTPYFFSGGESTQPRKTMNRVFHLVAEQATIDGWVLFLH